MFYLTRTHFRVTLSFYGLAVTQFAVGRGPRAYVNLLKTKHNLFYIRN